MSRNPNGGNAEGIQPLRAVPVRYWWLKRVSVGVLVLLAALVGLRLWWGRVAHARWQTMLGELRAAGRPVGLAELISPDLPNSQNTAVLLSKAATLVVANQSDDSKWLSANAPAFKMVSDARGLPGVNWKVRLTTPGVFTTAIPHLRPQYQLARALLMAGGIQHKAGDDAAALDSLHNMLFIASAIDTSPDLLVSHLVATGIGNLATRQIESMLPALDVRSASVRRRVEILIAALLDETAFHEGLGATFAAETAFQLDAVRCVLDGQLSMNFAGPPAKPSRSERIEVVLGRPVLELDGVFLIRHSMAQMKAAAEPDWPAAAKLMPPDNPFTSPHTDYILHPISKRILPAFSRAVIQHYDAIAMRRMAAIALAMRMYELDHGRPPDRLEALVPHYLPQVPADPFAAGSRSISYGHDGAESVIVLTNIGTNERPVGSTSRLSMPRRVLYSIGPDGTDDGGCPASDPGGRPWVMYGDSVFTLDGTGVAAITAMTTQPTTTSAPSPQTGDDQGNEPGRQGNADQDQGAKQQP